MSFFRRFFGSFTGEGNTRSSGDQSPIPGSYPDEAAANVNFDTAMTVSAFWACAKLLSESIASMPLKCYKNMPDGSKEQVFDNQLWRLLNFQPNKDQTSVEFWETFMLNLVTSGNAYSELGMIGNRIVSITPLMSAQMVVSLSRSNEKSFKYTDLNGLERIIPNKNIWHVKLFGNGLIGMSPLAYARQSIGVSIAAEKRVGKIAKNGGKTSGLLSIDHVLTPTQRDAVRKNMLEIANGDTDGLKILEADMKFQRIGLSPEDMELLASRRFQVEDVARFMGVPSVLINDTSASTVWGSGIEQILGGFFKLGLQPYRQRIHTSIKRNLMPQKDWGEIDIELDIDALLRPDRKTRIETNAKAINSGQMTPNEARNDEGRTDKDSGDELLVNGSLKNPGESDEQIQA